MYVLQGDNVNGEHEQKHIYRDTTSQMLDLKAAQSAQTIYGHSEDLRYRTLISKILFRVFVHRGFMDCETAPKSVWPRRAASPGSPCPPTLAAPATAGFDFFLQFLNLPIGTNGCHRSIPNLRWVPPNGSRTVQRYILSGHKRFARNARAVSPGGFPSSLYGRDSGPFGPLGMHCGEGGLRKSK